MARGVRCYRCNRNSPKVSTKYFQNIPLGPTCYEVLVSRTRLRGMGEGGQMKQNQKGQVFQTSTTSNRVCPDKEEHCISCPYFKDEFCPLEIYYDKGT